MTIQQWCFSFRGRLERRAFWLWMALWVIILMLLFSLAGMGVISLQSSAFLLVLSLWPTAAIWIKRLHDRNKSGWWALLLVVAWILAAGNWGMLDAVWQWAIARFIPLLIVVMMFIDCGFFAGTIGENRFGSEPKRFYIKNSVN